MDDLFREAGDFEIEGQAGSAGIGWHLGGVSYIARTDNRYDNNNPDTEKKFALVLNGTRVGISFQDGLWRTNPEIFAKIIWPGANSHTGNQQYQAHDYSPWTIWTADGTRYEFGDAGTFPNAFSSTNPTATSLERTFGNQTFRVTKRWYLRKVTDPLGNSMEYSYQGEQGWEQGCVDGGWVSAGQHWYTRAIDPSAIHWSGQSGSYTMRVLFSYTSRTDTRITGDSTNDCLQPLYGSNNRLTAVTVQVLTGGAWHTMRSYSLGQSTYTFTRAGQSDKFRLYLSHLDHLGENGGQLIRYSFGYNPLNPNRILLTSASTSQGGSATYTYNTVRTSCSNSTCPFTKDRYAVTRHVTGDGLNNTRTVDYHYGTSVAPNETSAVADDGGFMGYQAISTTVYAANSTSSVIQWERLDSFSSGAIADRSNPHPLRGKLQKREVRNAKGGTVDRIENYDWKAYWLENGAWQTSATAVSWKATSSSDPTPYYPITWIRLEKETATTGSAVNEKRYTYEGAYGNQIQVQDYADGTLQRITSTEYYPNSSAWIVNKPANVRVYDSNSVCRAETRTVYDGNGGWYNAAPSQGLVRRIQRALTSCSTHGFVSDTDTTWQVSYFEYNSFGNQTRATEFGNSSAQDVTIRTSYETAYNLFPIEQWYDASTVHKETALYYGVNGLAITDGKAFWGAMQEHCGVNDVCSRQSYDQFGRRVYRWEAVAKGSAWAADSDAQVFWAYTPYGNGQTATTVLEWRNPRSEGNFVRKLYNGLGELIQEQRAYQNWTATNGQEIITDYLYDALGRQTRVGIPWLAAKYAGGTADTRFATTWINGFTATSYDAIGRVTWVTAPNGEQQQYGYVARQMSITGIGRNGDSNKILKWQETNGLGYLREVRTYNPSGSSWTLDGQIILTHNVLGNLTAVNHVGIGTSTFTYDVGGRKTAMSDINLGSWGYAYDRQGKLTRQTDARTATICLYYDGMARLTGKHFRWDTTCPASPSMNVSYGYDAGHSASNRSRGQLTSVSNSGYSKALSYNGQGLFSQETVSISGATNYITSYGYDAHLRPTTVTYPDAEVVTTGYNSMGLPSWLHSNVSGNIIDSVTYDEASRLTQRRSALSGQFYSQTYWPWTGTSSNTNGRLKEIRLGSSSGAANLLYFLYGYDSFGNIGGMNEQYNGGTTNSFTFCYDAQNRLIRGYTPFNASLTCATHTGGRTYSYDSAGRLTNYEGAAMTVGGLKPHLALPTGSYAIDSNGNLTNRLAQSLTWNHENRLESYSRTTPAFTESYLYDVDGIRVRKNTNGVNTFYPNRFYEQTGSAITKYYYFGGQRVAMRQGHTTPLTYLYGDHVGSTAYSTHDGGTFITEQGYWGYGRYRRGGALPTDHRFTGQKLDGSGLMYYNARYYDPDLGQFISPDPLVPDPSNLFDYNRYMYVRGNPMRYSDPTGHCATLDNGNADWEGDKECWTLAYQIYGLGLTEQQFAEDWKVSPEAWLNNIAKAQYADVNYLKPFFEKYAAAYDARTGQNYGVPNPVKETNSRPIRFSLDPKELGLAAMKAGTFVGPAIRNVGLALCAPGVTCLAGGIIAGVGTTYQVVGLATVAVDDFVIPYAKGANGEGYGEFHANVVLTSVEEYAEFKLLPVGKVTAPIIGLMIDASGAICVGYDC
jgi:RHS repeat-associated protein